MSQPITVQQIAEHVGGKVVGDGSRVLTGAKSLSTAGPSDLVFVEGIRFANDLARSKAGAVLLPESMEPPGGASGIRVSNPQLAMARALELLAPRTRFFAEVSPQAVLGRGVTLGESVGIGPGAVIGDGVRIGEGTEIHPGVTIGSGTVIGDDCILYAGAHVYHGCTIGDRVVIHSGAVIGADGFGLLQEPLPDAATNPMEPLRLRKIPQIGTVIIEDDVEIGANTCIDRAALDQTIVGKGTKIDDLVMIGHNCRIGRHVVLVAQAGVAGSVEIGHYVQIAAQAGIAGHIQIGNRAMIGAKAGVMKTVPDGKSVLGAPAIDARQALKAYSQIENLPEWRKTIADLQEKVKQLEQKLASA